MGSLKAARRALLSPILLLCFLAMANAQSPPATFNITTMLDAFPNFSLLNQLLSSTKVADEINSRQSITLLATANGVLSAFQASNPTADLSDVLRYHVLLQFLSLDELKTLNAENATSVTTLLQTTGRVDGNAGLLNIYNLPSGVLFGPTVAGASSNASLVTNITRIAFDISILQIDRVLVPLDVGAAPPTAPTPEAPASAPSAAEPVPASEPAPASSPATPASEPSPASVPTPASEPAPASKPTPASEPAPASKPTPASEPSTVSTEAPSSDAAPGSNSAPEVNSAGMMKGSFVASFVALLVSSAVGFV